MATSGFIVSNSASSAPFWPFNRNFGWAVVANMAAVPVLLAMAQFGGVLGLTDWGREQALFGAVVLAALVLFDLSGWRIVARQRKGGSSNSHDDVYWGLARFFNAVPWWLLVLVAVWTALSWGVLALKSTMGIG